MYSYLVQQKSRQYDTLSFAPCYVLPREEREKSNIYTDIYTDILRHFLLLTNCLQNTLEHKDDKVCAVPCGIPQGYSPAIFSAIVFIATNW